MLLICLLKELKGDIKLVKYFVDVITSSGKRKEKFLAVQQSLIRDNTSTDNAIQLGFNPKTTNELVQDIDIRWNSTYLLLERAYLLRTAVIETIKVMPELSICSEIDWRKIST